MSKLLLPPLVQKLELLLNRLGEPFNQFATKDKYYLNVEEVPNAEANANTNLTRKRPRSSKDYEKYKYVLPSACTIDREKHYRAIQLERNCALAMMDAEPGNHFAIHYDT